MNRFLGVVLVILFFCACDETKLPKPYGYIRGEFPAKEFVNYPKADAKKLPYAFKTPTYSVVVAKKEQADVKIHQDIMYPSLKAMVNLTYLKVTGADDLSSKLDYVNSNVYSHSIKASRIREREIVDSAKSVYGLCYYLEGPAASNCQFYLHNGKDQFARGVLYFMSAPNPDSLDPYVQFIQTDIDTLINSWEWK